MNSIKYEAKISAFFFEQLKIMQVKLEEEGALKVKLQGEKASLREQLVVLRNRLTRATAEKTANSNYVGDDVCRLLKKIKQLETDLAVFHTAEKPNEEAQVICINSLITRSAFYYHILTNESEIRVRFQLVTKYRSYRSRCR